MWARDTISITSNPIALLGAPTHDGVGLPEAKLSRTDFPRSKLSGTKHGPRALRAAGLARAWRRLGHTVVDCGDANPHAMPALKTVSLKGRANNATAVAQWTQHLSNASYDLMRSGATPVFLGGDHSLSIGTVDGIARYCRDYGRKLSVLWLDAHADFNTPETSPSGNLHGMSLAALCGEHGLDGLFGNKPRVTVEPSNVHVFGVRSLDCGEAARLARRGVDVVTMREARRLGLSNAIARVLGEVEKHAGVLHVSFDVDFLDPTIAPGVGTPVRDGATLEEARIIMMMLRNSMRVASLDVAELDPMRDTDGKTVRVLAHLVVGLFGKSSSYECEAARREDRHG